MPKAPKKSEDHLRKQCFSPEELQAMVGHLEEHADVVFSSDMRREAVARKKQIWAELAQRVSAVGTTPRTPRDCRKRWDDLRLRVRSLLSANCSQALQTGGGPSSPLKLAPWEETCAALIGTEAIKGVGEMECGAPSSADAGSEHEGDEPERSRPTTSSAKGRDQRVLARKGQTTTAPQRHIEVAPPPSLTAPAPANIATPRSEDSSISGEVAATAPLQIVDSPLSICGASEEEYYPTVHTPEPCNVLQVSCSDTEEGDAPVRSARGDAPGDADPAPSTPFEALSGHAAPIPCRDDTPSQDALRAGQLTALITEFNEQYRQGRLELMEELRQLRQVFTEGTNRVCEALGHIADALVAAHPIHVTQQEDTPSTSRPTPASPVRRSLRSQRRRNMPPPGPGSMDE
ncbi:myb-related transcription factor, partner of profilin-like [Ambystoma mexicanum]|uniref:myb-related transcription factor, partner of profilin-like n=1 Tax=Ambystoma mexicanum TaxID=8296 RepID=UPI0037E85C2A